VSLGRVSRAKGGDSTSFADVLTKAEDKLILALNDKDRLVREACCLALSNLKSVKGIPGIVHLW
jgi:hypothetical protein